MKIALIGYGKMGKAIEQIIIAQGKHEVVLKISNQNSDELTIENLQKADVAIEFTNPDSAIENIMLCLKASIPVVCGTTGWWQNLETIQSEFEKQNGALVYASNFSIGVNLFFAITNYAASLMKNQSQYKMMIDETHHTEKKDAPSGTAISLQKIIQHHLPNNEIPIEAFRLDNVIGTHNIYCKSEVDEISLTHKAYNRSGFAEGSILAAEWIANKKGVFEFKEVLGIK
jgi:4-hydroxy-tetrahydrodipicolinate reductase